MVALISECPQFPLASPASVACSIRIRSWVVPCHIPSLTAEHRLEQGTSTAAAAHCDERAAAFAVGRTDAE